MSWFRRCKDAVAKWGTEPAKFLLKTVLPAAIPGSGFVVDVADRVLSLVGGGAEEGDVREVASESELNTVGKILSEFDDRLAHLAEQLLEREDDSPEKLARLVVQEIKKDKELADALRDIAGLVSRFDRIDEAQRELLRKVGYGNDLQETMLGVARRQEVLILDFVQDQQVAKGQLRELADNVAKLNLAITDLAARPADALPKLRLLEAEQPNSAAVREAVAVGAAFAFDLDLTASSLERAVQLRPDDKPLAELCRQVTIKTRGIGGDSSRKPPKPADADAGFRPGDTIDGWKLLQLLGKGGFGQVFLAEKAGKRRALKVMLRELITDPHFEAKFKAEFLMLHSLGKQPHVVHFDDHGKDDATRNWYFTMEYIEGESLKTRLMRGPLPAAEAVKLFALLAGPGGLATVHEKGIVHRDIKPANILLTADGSPKLVDFGVALQHERGEETKSGGHTVMFASPEQLRGFPADKPSDVYSLVGCLWYALTKQEPGLFDPDAVPDHLRPIRSLFESALHPRPKSRPAEVSVVHSSLAALDPALLTPPEPEVAAAPLVRIKPARIRVPELPPGLKHETIPDAWSARPSPLASAAFSLFRWAANVPAPRRKSLFRPAVQVLQSRDGVAYPGDLVWVQIGIQNTGQVELTQFRAMVSSEHLYFGFIEGRRLRVAHGTAWKAESQRLVWTSGQFHFAPIVFGRIEPGQRLDRCLVGKVPVDVKVDKLSATLRFSEEDECEPLNQTVTWAIHPLPRPDISTAWHLEVEVAGRSPERRSFCSRKEFVDVVVEVANGTGDDLPDVDLVLKPVKVPTGVRVTVERTKLGTLADDATAVGRLSFTVDANAHLGPATFEVRVVSGDGRTFAIIPVETSIG